MNYKILNKEYIVKQVFNKVSDKYDFMNNLMSLGIHHIWKKKLIDWLGPNVDTKLIDVATGTGDIAKLYLKRTNFKGTAYCVDSNSSMINAGKKKNIMTKNVKWIQCPAEKLKFKNNFFDYYTISFGIRNVVNINLCLKEAYRVLKPGGRFVCLEFSKVENEILENFYQIYSKLIPKVGKLVVGSSDPYDYLVKSIKDFYNQNELMEKIKDSKFENVSYRNLSGGIAAIHSGWKI